MPRCNKEGEKKKEKLSVFSKEAILCVGERLTSVESSQNRLKFVPKRWRDIIFFFIRVIPLDSLFSPQKTPKLLRFHFR